MLLRDYLSLWLETYIEPTKAKNTANAYRYALAHLGEDTGAKEIDQVNALELQRDVNRLAAVYPRQGQLMAVALGAALKKARKLGLIPANPMEEVEKPKHEAREMEILEPAEASAYLAAAEHVPAGALLILMMCLGLRRNEARGLRCGDLDGQGILHVRHQRTRDGLAPLKSKSSRRDIPVPEPLRVIFSGAPGEYVVDVSEKSLRTQHMHVLRAIGVERRVTLHGLRHPDVKQATKNTVWNQAGFGAKNTIFFCRGWMIGKP